MPPPTEFHFQQRAVVWPATGAYNDEGEPLVDVPEETDCRWNWGRSEALDARGNVIALDVTVRVPQEYPVNSRMWLASDWDQEPLEEWYGIGSAGDKTEMMYVRTHQIIEDIRGDAVSYVLGLARYKDNPRDNG